MGEIGPGIEVAGQAAPAQSEPDDNPKAELQTTVNTNPTEARADSVEGTPTTEHQDLPQTEEAAKAVKENIVKFRQLYQQAHKDIFPEGYPPELQSQFDALGKLANKPNEFAVAYQEFLDRLQREMNSKYPQQAQKMTELINMIKNGEMNVGDLFEALTGDRPKQEQDQEANRELQGVVKEVAAAKKEGRSVNPNVLKSINWGRWVKIFGIGIIAIIGLLFVQGLSSGGAMAAAH